MSDFSAETAAVKRRVEAIAALLRDLHGGGHLGPIECRRDVLACQGVAAMIHMMYLGLDLDSEAIADMVVAAERAMHDVAWRRLYPGREPPA